MSITQKNYNANNEELMNVCPSQMSLQMNLAQYCLVFNGCFHIHNDSRLARFLSQKDPMHNPKEIKDKSNLQK